MNLDIAIKALQKVKRFNEKHSVNWRIAHEALLAIGRSDRKEERRIRDTRSVAAEQMVNDLVNETRN